MHSWRVLLLPFLEERQLYERYNLEEPWDSPANRILIDECPAVFRMHGERHGDRDVTNYLAVTGDGTVWPPDKTISYDSVTDGTERTILIVENQKSGIIWTEPRDLSLHAMTLKVGADAVHGISSWKNPPAVVFADGAVRTLHAEMSETDVRSLLLRADQEGDVASTEELQDGRNRPDTVDESEQREL